MSRFTIPGLTDAKGAEVAALLQKQLSAYNDLHLTLKHVDWNVAGPSFIGVHEMIDPEDLLIAHAAELEKFQWFVRAHLENAGGSLSNAGATTEKAAARSAVDAA